MSESKSDRPGLKFRLDQLVGVKDAARSLPALIERNEPVVLTRRGEPKAVLLPLAEYERVWLNEQGMNGVRRAGRGDAPGDVLVMDSWGCGRRIGMPGRETTCGDRGLCSGCWGVRRATEALMDFREGATPDTDEQAWCRRMASVALESQHG